MVGRGAQGKVPRSGVCGLTGVPSLVPREGGTRRAGEGEGPRHSNGGRVLPAGGAGRSGEAGREVDLLMAKVKCWSCDYCSFLN